MPVSKCAGVELSFIRDKILAIVLLTLLLGSSALCANYGKIDSLKQILRNTAEGETVDLLNQLSQAHAGVEWKKSQRYAGLALDLATSLDDRYGLAIAHTNLAHYYNHAENYRDALDHATLALDQFEYLSNDLQIAKALRTLGTIYGKLNQSDQSLDHYLRALMIFEDTDKDLDIAQTLMIVGDVYQKWSHTEKALRFIERALSIYTEMNDTVGILVSENQLSQALMTLLRFSEAKDHLEHALVLVDNQSSPLLLAGIYTSLGELYYYQFQLDIAQQFFLDALEIKKNYASSGEIAIALSDVGSIYHEAGKTDLALRFYRDGQALAQRSNEDAISSEIYLLIGDIHAQAGRQAEAIEAMLSGLNIAQKINDLQTIERANQLLSELYARFGRLDKALVYQKALQVSRDDLNNQQNSQRVAELEIRYELDKRDRELVGLRGDALVKDIEYKRQFATMWIVLTFSFILMLIVVGFVFYRSRLIRQNEQEKMEHALRIKADFTAMLVHDLRSPLTSVFGFAELLKMGDKPYERIREIALTIRETSQKMLHLVNEMLDLSKFEAGKMVLNKTDLAVKPLINTSIQMLEPVASQRETKIVFDGIDGLPICHCDALKIEQVITNFISNALEHTPKGSTVDVHLQEVQKLGVSYLFFSVEDNGAGVELSQQKKIFDKYAQLENRSSNMGHGTGLGLAVSQMIIEQHGGEVGYRDREPNGSIFYFQIPCKQIRAPETLRSTESLSLN